LDNNTGGPKKDSISSPVEGGYESVYMLLHMRNNEELQVKVNGRIIGAYTKSSDVYLDGFLMQNALNNISFTFSQGATESDVELKGKFRGDDKWNVIFNFNPKGDKTESKFELPFAGKSEMIFQ